MGKEKQKFQNKTIYSFTICPVDTRQHWAVRIHRLLRVYEEVLTYLHKYIKPYAKYQLRGEVSTTGRCHFHGTIQFHDYIGWKLYGYKKFTGFIGIIEIDTIKDTDTWESYCVKDKEEIEPLMRSTWCGYVISNLTRECREPPGQPQGIYKYMPETNT